jgi:hypothetical protein
MKLAAALTGLAVAFGGLLMAAPTAQAAEDIEISTEFLQANASGPGWTYTANAEADAYAFDRWNLFEVTDDVTISGFGNSAYGLPLAFRIADGAKVTWKANGDFSSKATFVFTSSEGTFEFADGLVYNVGQNDQDCDGMLAVDSHVRVQVTGGKFEVNRPHVECSAVNLPGSSLELSGGEIKSNANGLTVANGSSYTISGGTLNVPGYPLREIGKGKVTIAGGVVRGDSIQLKDKGSYLISGGTIQTGTAFISAADDDPISSDYGVTIKGTATIRTAKNDTTVDADSGIVYYGKQGRVYGKVRLTEDLTVNEGERLVVLQGSELRVPVGITVTGRVSGKVVYDSSDIADATISVPQYQVWTGKALTPTPTVTLNGAPLKAGADYTVAYANNTNVGPAKVTVTGTGDYQGSASAEFTVVPVTTKITKATAGKKAVTVRWAKVKAGAQFVQLQYGVKGSKATKTIKVKAGSLAKKITGLKKGKQYTFKVRAVKSVGSKYYYSAWSPAKTSGKVK